MFLFLFFDVNCRKLFVNFFFLTANFANFTNAYSQDMTYFSGVHHPLTGVRRLIGGELLEKLAQVGRVLRGSGGWLVILVGERWFA